MASDIRQDDEGDSNSDGYRDNDDNEDEDDNDCDVNRRW